MKTTSTSKIVTFLAAALFAGSLATASAGPAAITTFRPINSEKEAMKLKVGSQIAVSCDKCHGVTVSTVDAERAYVRTYTCPMCKLTFKTTMPGGGGRGSAGSYSYTDGAGHTAHLAAVR